MFLSQDGAFYYLITTETTEDALKYLPGYLLRYYLLQHQNYRNFKNAQIDTNRNSLSYKVIVPTMNEYVTVNVLATKPIRVTITPSSPNINKKFLDELYEDLFLGVQLFEEAARKSTLYFAFMPGEKMVPEKQKSNFRIRLFSDSMLSLYVTLLAVAFFLFFVLGPYAPIVFVIISFTLALFSGRLLARSADWKITQQRPELVILQYKLSQEEEAKFLKTNQQLLSQLRRELFEASFGSNLPLSCETANAVFTKYGVKCSSENFAVKQVNLYDMVKRVTDRFKLSMPKVVVTNSVIPNAAAAGPSPKFGTVIITTGILTQLEDNELESVIGHEISHLKAHDPLVMSTIASAEFLLRFYVFFPFLFAFGLLSF
jgi:heat shock protein HtpX